MEYDRDLLTPPQGSSFGKLVIRGTAPDHVTFEFRQPRDRGNETDEDR
jgi:hypothetical protein